MTSPTENLSNLDHHLVDQEEDANPAAPNVGNAGVENSTELDPERNGEVVVNITETDSILSLLGLDPERNRVVVVNLTETDGIPSLLVVYENGTRVRLVLRRHNDHNSPPHNLGQIALAFYAQLTAVFVANVTNKPPHSSDNNWAAVAVATISLVGFVVTLISVSTAKTRAIISSATAKLAFAAVATVLIISVGMALPLDANGKIAVSVAACLPALVAILRG